MQGGYQNNSNRYHSGGGYRGGRHGTGGREPSWYETVKTDRSVQERPKWNLTCYGHRREEDNDIRGDISPEEVRYANMISMQQGIQQHALGEEFRRANKQRVDLFQGLTRGRQAPSIEGRPVIAPYTIQNMVWIQSTSGTGFGSTAGAMSSQSRGFGSGRGFGGGFGAGGATTTATAAMAAPSSSSPFGNGGGFGGGFGAGGATTTAATAMAAPSSSSPFGNGGGFGGGFGAGGAITTATTAPSSSSPFGGGFVPGGTQNQASPFVPQQQQGGFGAFNQQQSATNASIGGFGNGFVQQMSTSTPQQSVGGGFPQQQLATPQTQITEEESKVWMTDSFGKGSIPTIPPPHHVCM